MADLFGNWDWESHDKTGIINRSEVINRVLFTANHCQQHTFIFLTKNPKGMQDIIFPDNCWCGTSVENQEKADERIPELLKVNCETLFVSYEPALGPIDFSFNIHDMIHPDNEGYGVEAIKGLQWLIIGSQTGPKAVEPKYEWIRLAFEQARNVNIPVFIKDNAADYYGGELLPREWPEVKA